VLESDEPITFKPTETGTSFTIESLLKTELSIPVFYIDLKELPDLFKNEK
jgi:hypothetical protein